MTKPAGSDASLSLWIDTTPATHYAPLQGEVAADVAMLSIAFLLAYLTRFHSPLPHPSSRRDETSCRASAKVSPELSSTFLRLVSMMEMLSTHVGDPERPKSPGSVLRSDAPQTSIGLPSALGESAGPTRMGLISRSAALTTIGVLDSPGAIVPTFVPSSSTMLCGSRSLFVQTIVLPIAACSGFGANAAFPNDPTTLIVR